MLDSFFYSVNAVLPVFILVIIGFVLKKYGKITEAFTDIADWIVFKVSLPVMLFLEVAKSSVSEGMNAEMILFVVIAVSTAFLLTSVTVALTVKDKDKRGALIQGICRSNFAILGTPIAVNMFGDIGGVSIAVAMPFVILMYNSYSVIVLSVFSKNTENKLNKKTLVSILKNIVTNPLIIGVALALPFMIFEISLPTVADKSFSYISALATPLALISIGASFKLDSLKGRIGYAVCGAVCKTVILPTIALTTSVILGLRGISLGVILLCFGTPSAVSSYIMAKKMDNDHELAAQILLLSTFLCVVTIFIGIFILKTAGLI